jgi:hypothetical protein
VSDDIPDERLFSDGRRNWQRENNDPGSLLVLAEPKAGNL